MEKVSIVIPVYNTEKYLPKCLDSIIAQSYENWECILVDDGSADASGDICEAYTAKDSRFKTVHQENKGVSGARNQGIALSGGKFITFVDSDDYLTPTYLQVMVEGICTSDTVITVCGFAYEDREDPFPRGKELFSRRQALLTLFGERGIGGYIGGKMFLTEILRENGLQFDEQQSLAEDLIFVYRYLSCCRENTTVFFGKQPLYCYVRNENSALESRNYARAFNRKWLTVIDAYDKICRDCKDKRIIVAAKNGKVMQCVTLMRIMARHDLCKDGQYRQLRAFVRRNLANYLADGNFSVRKRMGAALVLILPDL